MEESGESSRDRGGEVGSLGWREIFIRWCFTVVVTCGPLVMFGVPWVGVGGVFALEVVALVYVIVQDR